MGKQKKSERDRRARQAATLRKTLASPAARALKREAAKNSWTPERRATQGPRMAQTWSRRKTRAARINGIKKAWTPGRRASQGARMKNIMADPEANARRLAGLERARTDPDIRARKAAALRKTLARPEVRARRIAQVRKMSRKPEVRAAKSERMTKIWADLKTAAGLKKPQKRGPKPTSVKQHQWFKTGSAIHRKIPSARSSDAHAITAARKAYSKETGIPLETCSRYHERYVVWLKENPSIGLAEVPSQ